MVVLFVLLYDGFTSNYTGKGKDILIFVFL